ncbi:40S ribosomal protein S5-1 [Hordeum vulgare]|nr:40S ribosomal protein S5-1 [Hordeum vulgare]
MSWPSPASRASTWFSKEPINHPSPRVALRPRVLHIRDVEGPKKTGSVEARLEAMEQQVFKCQGMVEHRLNANHIMIMKFTNKNKIDANDIGKHLSRLYDRIDHLQAQIYDLQNQNCWRDSHWRLAWRQGLASPQGTRRQPTPEVIDHRDALHPMTGLTHDNDSR